MAALKLMVILVAMVVASFQLQGTVSQTRHVVGDALGWTIPSVGAAAYTTWASRQTFTVGDTLLFNFTTGIHNVAEVSPAAYGPCTTSNPMSIITAGPATVTLTTVGTHYYICAVGGHCPLGQKLTIKVSTGTGTGAIPPSTFDTSPSPAGSTMPPPPSSTAPSIAAVVPVSFLAVALISSLLLDRFD